jgi:hypothetical protein
MGEVIKFGTQKRKRASKPRFKQRDIVVLRGGSCPMTVDTVTSKGVLCLWHNCADDPVMVVYDAGVLEPVTEECASKLLESEPPTPTRRPSRAAQKKVRRRR